jgi:hypothetical protein
MFKSKKPKIVVFDDYVAHGTYICGHFDKEVFHFSSKYKDFGKLIQYKPAAFIFVVNDLNSIQSLGKHLNTNYNKVLICSENYHKETIPIDIPFDFISLNSLKDFWMKEVIEWLFKEQVIDVSDFIKINNKPLKKYIKENNSIEAFTI